MIVVFFFISILVPLYRYNMRLTVFYNSIADALLISRQDSEVSLAEIAPGRFQTVVEGTEMGLYRVTEGTRQAVIAIGPAAPREFEETIATADILSPLAEARRGGIAARCAGDAQCHEGTVVAHFDSVAGAWSSK